MTTILLVRFDDDDTFGVAPAALEAADAIRRVWTASDPAEPRPGLDAIDGVVVFGSIYNVEHADEQPFIKEAAELLREAVERRTPVLGVCFGGQLLAWALDAEIGRAPVRELGFEPIRPTAAATHDPLFSHLAPGDRAFQWHMDTFALPDGAELLVTGDQVANQAFRFGDLAWGTQFHFEVDRPEVELWLEGYRRVGDLEADWGKGPARIREEMDRFIADHEARGREIFERFTHLVRGIS